MEIKTAEEIEKLKASSKLADDCYEFMFQNSPSVNVLCS